MKKQFYIWSFLLSFAFVWTGCSKEAAGYPVDPSPDNLPRLVIRGTVTNTDDEPLQGIYVAVYGVREEIEQELLTYNYAITDAAGKYTIIRYRGHDVPADMTVVATDPAGVYQEQLQIVPIQYDTLKTYRGQEPYNGYVTADFVLSHVNSQQ